MKKITFNLNEYLKESEITQRELSRRTKELDPEGIGVRQALISDICRNKTDRPPLSKLALICEALGCDLSDIMKLVKK